MFRQFLVIAVAYAAGAITALVVVSRALLHKVKQAVDLDALKGREKRFRAAGEIDLANFTKDLRSGKSPLQALEAASPQIKAEFETFIKQGGLNANSRNHAGEENSGKPAPENSSQEKPDGS